jgi:hypothetical protein
VNEIKSWQWQYLSVRYEEQDEEQYCDDDLHQSQQRKLPIDFIELDDKEDSMSKLGQYCRDADLEHMFLACLKLSPTNEKKSSTSTTTSTTMVRKDGVEHDTTTTATNVRTTTMTTTMMNNNIKSPSHYGVLVQVDHMNDVSDIIGHFKIFVILVNVCFSFDIVSQQQQQRRLDMRLYSLES